MISDFVSGFTSSPLEVSVVLALMIIGVIALIVTARIKSRKERRRVEQHGERAFQDLVQQYDLSESEVLQLRTLAQELEHPHKRYLLLRNQALFDRAAILAQETGAIDASAISALRVRLGYAGSRAGVRPAATTELPEGDAVILRPESADGSSPTWQGTVVRQTREALAVSLEKTPAGLDQGAAVLLFYFDHSGVYRTATRVVGESGDLVYLAHTEGFARLQRRQFDRADVQLPVTIRSVGQEEREPQRGVLLDVGGGGARVRCPGANLRTGSEIDLSLHPDTESTLSVSGTVIRISSGGAVFHVSFNDVKQSKQDRLYKLIFDLEQQVSQSQAPPAE